MTPRKHFVTRLALVATMVVLSVVGSVAGAWAQTQPAPQTLPYSQDFSGLAWTSTTYPAGWQGWQISTTPGATFSTVGPTGDRALVASRDASVTNGDVDNYNGKIGFLNNGSLDLTLGLVINTSDKSGITVSYDIMTIRNAQDGTNSRQNEVTLQYRAGIAGPWTTLTGVEYTNLTGAINNQTGAVTTPQNLQTKSIVLPAACEGHPVLQLRWASRQVSGTGSRPSFAVDNVSVSASGTLPALPDLIARWALDGNIDDASGNSLASGTTAGSPTYVTGLEGTQALNLNGTNQYAAVPHDYRLNATNAITLAAWIRPGKTGTQALITKSINGTAATGVNGYELSLATTGFPFVRFNQATSGDTYRLNATTVNTSNGTNWMHLAATYDGATARIYVNGVLNASAAMVVPIATNSVPVGIGSQFDGTGSRFFQGAMDDARVYSRALSAAEIEALASHTLAVTATNGTVANSPDQPSYLHNSSVSLTASPSAGYHFVNWTGDTAATANPLPVLMIRNKSVTANFALNTYTLTYNATAGGSIVGTSPQTVNHGADGALVTATPNAGYHFVSWSDAYPTAARTDLAVAGDITVTATFALNTYTLTYNASAGGSIVGTSPQIVNHGADGALVTATPSAGYHFVSWSDAYPTAARTDIGVTADITVTATFAPDTYTLTYNAGAGGTIVGTNPQTVNHGADGTLVTATPNVGYHFVSWSDAYPTAARTDLAVTGDITATATFAINTYTLTYGAGAGGSIVGTSPQIVNHGADGALVTATPNAGFHFVAWSDAYPTAARTDLNVTADLSVSASFAPDAPTNTSTVSLGAAPGLITLTTPVRTIPVTISRTDVTPMMAFSVVFSVSSPLALNGGLSGIHQGAYLSDANPVTSFNVIDKGVDGFGNHSYQADGTTLGAPCGSSAASGTLFTIDLSSAAPNGSGTVTITSLKLRDCGNADLSSVIGTTSSVTVDQSAPTVHLDIPNTAVTWRVGATETIEWTASDAEGLTTIDLAYSTDGGATYPNAIATVPATQSTYAWTIPATPSTQVRVRATAHDTNGNTAADASDVDFTIAYYTLTYTAGANGSITGTSPQSVALGGNGTAVTAVPALGYHFVSWSDGVLTASRTDLNVTADISVTATFAINTYTLTYTAGANGSITGSSPQTVNYGANGTAVTAVADLGYHFVSWSDGVLTASRTDLNVTADITVTATFAINTYTLTYTAGANGSLTGATPQTVNYGGNGTTVTAVPDLGYHFVSWSDGVLTAARTDLNVTADISVTATFAINTFTLTYTAGANGSITGTSPQTVNYGGNGTTVTAVPDLGYHFVSWSDGVLTASRTDLNVTADITVTATFAINTYTLTYTAGPNGSISGTTPQTVAQGGNGTPVTAVPDVGYHFVSWSDGVLTAGRTDLNVTADITVTATFAANPAVPAITHLTATQNRTGNPAGATTGITLSWDATPNTVEVWRLGFGSYPEYDDAGGAIPTASASYPPGGAWVKTTVTAPGGVDYVTTRDFYYYVAYQQDGYGTWSPAVLTTGTLNYHLGDVSDGITAGAGNNLVFTGDVSLLGAHYGLVGGGVAAYAYLDVGPTTTMFIDGRPTTDNEIGFEDLVIFAINYNAVSAPSSKATPATSGAANELVLEAPQHVEAGAAVSARLTMSGAGNLVALSTKLSWDPAVVQPVGHAAGEWLTAQQGVAFSATPGTVDAAVMQSQGMSGSGVMATLTFRVLSAGDPKIRIVSTDGRDASNQKVAVANSLLPQAPLVTQLAPSKPNPFRQSATLSFSLAKGGPVEMHLYSVDGRRVRTLVNGVRGAGEYSLVWDGRDDNGTPLAAGVYYLRLSTPQGRFTRTMTYLK